MELRSHPAFQHVRWRPTARELRAFALSMLVGFCLLGLLAAWREGGPAPRALALWIAGCILAAGALVPWTARATFLAVWVPVSLLGFLISRLLLTLIFFLLFMPIGLLLRLLGKDPLRLKPSASLWTPRAAPEADSYYRQF